MSLDQHLSKVEGHLRAANIPKKQAKLYKNAAKRILGRMTAEGLQRVSRNVSAYYYYRDLESLEAVGGEGSLGFYRTNNRTLHLDDGGTGRDSIHRTYAHEYTHALDGPEDEISGSAEWQAAWQEEIVEEEAFSGLGADSPDEGLAQLGELMLRGERDVARAICPK